MSQFNGTWTCESVQGLEKFLEELSVPFMQRKFISQMKVKITIEMKPDNSGFNFENNTGGTITKKTYDFDSEVDESHRNEPGTFTLKLEDGGNKMVGKFFYKNEVGKCLTTERTIDENGKLVQKQSIKNATCVRIFSKN